MSHILTARQQDKAITDQEYELIIAYRKADNYDKVAVLRKLGINDKGSGKRCKVYEFDGAKDNNVHSI